jgi:glycosyltransferase involved in cell wall biosynthesis
MKRKSIVLALSHSEPAGAQLIWTDLASALRARGYTVSLLAIYPGRVGTSPVEDGLKWTYCLNKYDSLLDLPYALRMGVNVLKALSADVILTALPAANVLFPALNAFIGSHSKVFISHHSPVYTYNKWFNRLDGLIGASHAVDGIVCVSDAVLTSLSQKSRAYRAKACTIRNGLPPEVEEEIIRLRSEYPAENRLAKRIIAIGRLAKQKNFPVLIRAMAHIEDASVEIIGTGPDENFLKRLVEEYGVTGRVQFVGRRTRHDALVSMAMSDVFVQPSLFEGHSLALIEAAKFGLPMVISNTPSQVEGVTGCDQRICAMMHDPNDHMGLANAITSLLTDVQQRHKYRALSDSLGREISFSAMVDRYESLLFP